ncbi:hypothetical protein Tco_0000096 [Tanacetum coccineum]
MPQEILAAEAGKFKPPPLMVTPVEKRSSNKFCDFHNDKGHSTEECMQLKKQIEELAPGDNRRRRSFYKSMDEFHDREVTITIQWHHRMTWNKRDHGMLKFLVNGGIVTICSTILIPAECARVTTSSKEILKEAVVLHENLKVFPHLNFPNQEVAIRGTLSEKGRTELCSLLKENLDIFGWQPSDMTGVPQSISEHRLNIRKGYTPVRQKKRGQAPERAKAIQAEV